MCIGNQKHVPNAVPAKLATCRGKFEPCICQINVVNAMLLDSFTSKVKIYIFNFDLISSQLARISIFCLPTHFLSLICELGSGK